MKSGLDGFKQLLKEFRGLSVWAVGGGVAVPFAAALVDLSPPWPKGVVVTTALVELVMLIIVYQLVSGSPRRTVNRLIVCSAIVLALVSIVYLAAASVFTFEIPTTQERGVKGFVCTANALLVYRDHCPLLGNDELRAAGYEAERLWTSSSVAAMRLGLVTLWSAAFATLSLLIGSFIVFQSGQGRSRRDRSATAR